MSGKLKRPPNGRDAAAYIGDMSKTLAELARQHRLATLGYLFKLAQMEAEQGGAAGAALRASVARRRSMATRLPSAKQSGDQWAEDGK
jgi:hypothetical protein